MIFLFTFQFVISIMVVKFEKEGDENGTNKAEKEIQESKEKMKDCYYS